MLIRKERTQRHRCTRGGKAGDERHRDWRGTPASQIMTWITRKLPEARYKQGKIHILCFWREYNLANTPISESWSAELRMNMCLLHFSAAPIENSSTMWAITLTLKIKIPVEGAQLSWVPHAVRNPSHMGRQHKAAWMNSSTWGPAWQSVLMVRHVTGDTSRWFHSQESNCPH